MQTSFEPRERTSSLAMENNDVMISTGINLKEVVITKKKDAFNGRVSPEGAKINRCGDYVCNNNILNCINHAGDSGNRPPKPNGRYRNQDGNPVTYFGCATREVDANISILKGIRLPKDFYTYDITNIAEPITVTTIYWNHQISLNGVGQAAIHFATGDLTGEFKIVVQGMINEVPIYAEKMISVLRP